MWRCFFGHREKRIGEKTVFLCDICGLGYSERKTAQNCEDYCRSHSGSCSAEISKKAVYTPGASDVARVTIPKKVKKEESGVSANLKFGDEGCVPGVEPDLTSVAVDA